MLGIPALVAGNYSVGYAEMILDDTTCKHASLLKTVASFFETRGHNVSSSVASNDLVQDQQTENTRLCGGVFLRTLPGSS